MCFCSFSFQCAYLNGFFQVCSKAVVRGNKNKRLNTSLLIRYPKPSGISNILIDAGKYVKHAFITDFIYMLFSDNLKKEKKISIKL